MADSEAIKILDGLWAESGDRTDPDDTIRHPYAHSAPLDGLLTIPPLEARPPSVHANESAFSRA